MCQPRPVFLLSSLPLVAVVVSLAAAAAPATEVKPVQVEIDASLGCSTANDFLNSLRSRTHLVRQATGDEPRTTLQLRQIETRRDVLGQLRMVDERGEIHTRRVQGASCDVVVQALSLAAAVALDPSVLLSEPVPEPVPLPAPATTVPAIPPAPIPPAPPEAVNVAKQTRADQSGPSFELGAASLVSVLLSSGVSPGVAVLGRWTPAGGGRFRPTVGMAILYLRNDILQSPGAAQASLSGLAGSVCGVGFSTSILTVKACALMMAGLLSVSGHEVALSSSVAVLWLSAGAVVRTALHLGRGFSLDLEAGVSAPFMRREFYTTLPSHVVEKTPAISPVASLGLVCGL